MSVEPGDKTDPADSGKIIAGRYQLVRQLGAGGMGVVYQARQLSMDRIVALKLIHAHIATHEDAAKRFHREMKATSKIEHPNTVRVFDYGAAEDGQLFLAMEFLDGRPLAGLISEAGALPLERLLHIATQIARALAAAHEEGIAHRDLKPDNVMLIDRYGEHDFVKVLDFGIARFLGGEAESTRVTAEGAPIGTPMYMSPEQALGRAVDERTDLYSLGVMLYEMAVGRPPFSGPTLASLLMAHANEPPPPPSSIATIAPPLEALILQLLAKSPADRPSSAAHVVRLLEACGSDGTAPSPSPPARRKSWRSPARVALIAALLVGGVLIGGVTLQHLRASAGSAARARLEALQLADGDPLAPPACRASAPAIVEQLARSAAWLHDSSVGQPRPPDRDALALLGSLDPQAAGLAEYWTLLARARLVVEPTPEAALEAAQRAVALCPQFALAHNLVGNAEQRAHHDSAAAAYERALALAPDYLAPRFNLGLLALRAGDARQAISAFDAVLGQDPLHPRAHLARGQARLLLGQIAPALDDLEQATLRQPKQAEAWLLLGQARRQAGLRSARDAFCTAKALGSDEGARLCR